MAARRDVPPDQRPEAVLDPALELIHPASPQVGYPAGPLPESTSTMSMVRLLGDARRDGGPVGGHAGHGRRR